ncbi:Uncharacterised protein [Mycobacteroides abscessus subsp. abscessus]|nr:Uncharacterised protein [Mycobacteroides abscessus subsp. abscessus]SKV42270.1 Uncharacterised protein [Mycobacteroides abscessus subsp. abscessus]
MAAHCRQRTAQPCLIPLSGRVHQPLVHRTADQRVGKLGESLVVPLCEHLGVPGHPEDVGQQAQLVERFRVGVQTETLGIGLQQTADTPNGDPHLMHGVVSVHPNRAIPALELVQLLEQCPLDGILALGPLTFGHVENTGQFGAVPGGHRTCVEQTGGNPVEQCDVGAARELQLPFPPAQVSRGDVIVAEFGQLFAVGADQPRHQAHGADPRDRREFVLAHHRQHGVPQLFGDRVIVLGEGQTQLGPGVRPRRQLQMPPGIGAAGAAPQGDVVLRQPLAGCVEVHSV